MMQLLYVVVFLLFTYPIGIVIGVVVWTGWLLGAVKIIGLPNFPWWRTKLLVVLNHPTLLDPVVVLGLFSPQYLFRPFRYGPKTVVDPETYFDGWKRPFWWILWPGLIPVTRSDSAARKKGLDIAITNLEGGAIVSICPEGGRTPSPDRSKKRRRETNGDQGSHPAKPCHLVSPGGKRLRPLKKGVSSLATIDGVLTLPIWIEWRGWLHVTIVIGEPVSYQVTPPEEVVRKVQEVLLGLADQAD